MDNPSISIIIPAHNEAQNIGSLIEKLIALYSDFEIIVIDDGSTDATADVAQSAGARVYSHPYNIGNGAAIKTGIRVAGGDIFMFMDGDGQHDPEDIRQLLKHLPRFDMVVGVRPKYRNSSFVRAFGNSILNKLASYVANFSVKDLTSGFRAIKADVARSFLYIIPNAYSCPTTLTLGVLRDGRSLRYIPVSVQKRKMGKSQIKIIRDGLRFFFIMVKICTLYSPFRVFLPVSGSMFLLGVLNYVYTFITQGRFTNMSALVITAAILIFMMSLISEQICQMRYDRRGGDRPFIRKNRVEANEHSITVAEKN